MEKQTVYVVIISGQYAGVAATIGQAYELLPSVDHLDYVIKQEIILPYN